MNAPVRHAPLTNIQREALEKLLAMPESKIIREKSVSRATDIRRLALDGLDDKAIAAVTGATVSSVSTVVARMRRSHGAKLPRRNASKLGLLIKLQDEARGRLQIEATRRGMGANTFANVLLTELLRGDRISKLLGG